MRCNFLIFLFILPCVIFADTSCRTECNEDRMPQCGTWLISETNSSVSGTYKLSHGVVNMSCVFSSLPTPAIVSWVYRTPNGANWNEFACSAKDENKQCSQESEHRVTSRCILRTNSLTQTGSYRCQAKTVDQTSKTVGSEIVVQVYGISSVEVKNHSLSYGNIGFVELEVCANPKPELFWHVGGQIVRPHEGTGRASVSHVHPVRVRQNKEDPSQLKPYCYSSRLILSDVLASERIAITVRNEGETRTVPIDVQVTGAPKKAATSTNSLISMIFVMASLTWCSL